jgi:hypothetical protein
MTKDQYLELAVRMGIPADKSMTIEELEDRVLKGMPRPKAPWVQIVATVLTGIVVAVSAYTARQAERSADAAARAVDASIEHYQNAQAEERKGQQNFREFMALIQENVSEDLFKRRQESAVYDIMERDAVATGNAMSFDAIKRKYHDEVIRDKKWGGDLAKREFNEDKLRQVLINLISMRVVTAVYPEAEPRIAAYIVYQGSLTKNADRCTPINDTKLDIIAKVYDKSGEYTLDQLRKDVPAERKITNKEWAILITDLMTSNHIYLVDGRAHSLANLPKTK